MVTLSAMLPFNFSLFFLTSGFGFSMDKKRSKFPLHRILISFSWSVLNLSVKYRIKNFFGEHTTFSF